MFACKDDFVNYERQNYEEFFNLIGFITQVIKHGGKNHS